MTSDQVRMNEEDDCGAAAYSQRGGMGQSKDDAYRKILEHYVQHGAPCAAPKIHACYESLKKSIVKAGGDGEPDLDMTLRDFVALVAGPNGIRFHFEESE